MCKSNTLDTILSAVELGDVMAKLEQVPQIAYVEPDVNGEFASTSGLLNPLQWDMTRTSVFNNLTYYGNYFTGNSSGTSGTYVPANYGQGVVIAVVDSGYTPHPNFMNSLLPLTPGGNQYGYQLFATCGQACSCAPGENPDTPIPFKADALDLCGDPWHGTHLIGVIAANGYNNYSQNQGISGGAPAAKIVPVRVAGGVQSPTGFTATVALSDIINGIMWAGGHHVDGALDNSNPAQVINISLGIPQPCSSTPGLAEAIDILHKEKVNIVAAAMNNTENVNGWVPASCPNVISVAAAGPTQKLIFYSDYGNVTISAAGGDPTYWNGQVYSTTCLDDFQNTGCNHQNASNFGWSYSSGTSEAAPHVCAAIATLLSQFLKLTPDQVIEVLQSSATPYMMNDNCNTVIGHSGCVTNGILNTEAAINDATEKYSSFK